MAGDGDVSGRGWPLLILGGYSYGAMIASHLPSIDIVAALFETPTPGSAQSEIKLRAVDLARDGKAYLDAHTTTSTSILRATLSLPSTQNGGGQGASPSNRGVIVGGYESDAASRRISRESSRRSMDGERVRQSFDRVRRKINARHGRIPEPEEEPRTTEPTLLLPSVAYLLISPLLPPVAGFTTMFSKLKFSHKGRDTGKEQEEYHELTAHPCCCLFGSKDIFTSDRKLQKWTADLSSRSGSPFTAIRVDVGHFWHEAEGLVRLRQGLADWLRTLAPEDKDPSSTLRAEGSSQPHRIEDVPIEKG